MKKVARWKLPQTIVVDPHASKPEVFAAQELRDHLSIVGVNAVVAEKGKGPTVYIGKQFVREGASQALRKVRHDGFVLYRNGSNVYIAGKLSRGTLFGCYAYIESLGIRWPGPGLPAEVTSQSFEIADNAANGLDNPDFPVRANNCYFPTNQRDFQITLETVEWLTRQRYNLHSFLRGDVPTFTDFDEFWYKLADFVHQRGLEFALGTHLSWSGLLMYQDKYLFNKHPEYFPMRQGKRQPSGLHGPQDVGTYGPDAIATLTGSGMSLCVSNPKVVEIITQNLRLFIDEHPEIDVMGMWPPDTKWEGCECPNCRKLVSPERIWSNVPYHERQWRVTSDLVMHLVGQVAARVKKTHPKIRILTWGWCTCEPAPQNVVPEGKIQVDHAYLPCFTHAMSSENCNHHHIHPEAWREWGKSKNVDFGWIYTGAHWTLTTAEFPCAWLIKKNIELLREIGGKAVTYNLEIGGAEDDSTRCDMTDHYMFSGCGVEYYVLARCAWDTDIPLEQLYGDFAEARFGTKAAKAMTEYYTQIIERYESWQHTQPLPDFTDVWGSSKVRCRAPWEAAIDIFTPEMIKRSTQLLDMAKAACKSKSQEKRIQLERQMFKYTMLMRKVFHLHLARQNLEHIGDKAGSGYMRDKQLKILAQARKINIPKHLAMNYGDFNWVAN